MNQLNEGDGAPASSAREILGHPLRIRIVAACSRRERTAAELAERFGVSVGTINKHLRELKNGEYLRVRVETVRGVTRKFYTAARRALIADEDFAGMSLKERRQSSEEVIRDLFRHMWAAWEAETLDQRPDSHLTWNQMQLDELGWRELMDTLLLVYEMSIDIEAASLDRLHKSGERSIPTVIALGGFEGPPSRPPKAR